MSILDNIKRGGQNLPPRVLLCGPEGIGKSSFGAAFPDPLFLAPEEGLTGLDHVAHLSPASWEEVLDTVQALTVDAHGHKSFVIDTSDSLERLLHDYLVRKANSPKIQSIEDVGGGWQKGYKAAEQELSVLLQKLDLLRARQNMSIVILSHVEIKNFMSPDGTAWDRYQLKGHKFFTALLREWPDACLFATYEVFKMKEGRSEKAIAGDRVIHTNWSPAWEAKNRLGLPDVLPLDYEVFIREVEKNSPPSLRKKFLELLETSTLDAETRKAWVKTPIEQVAPDRIRAGIAKLENLQPSK
jgi:hypothetical protein